MSLIEALLKELDEKPELASKLWRALLEAKMKAEAAEESGSRQRGREEEPESDSSTATRSPHSGMPATASTQA
ncbi:MAG: hypothetical protein DRN96_08330 [Thermoproteota archaeon]|nr:MAG: hypothetical protein DRN96_08330 [Candidatus Korarchaeota archaeon]